MDFSCVLKYLKDGAVARRKSWSGSKSIFLAKDIDGILPFFCINTKDGHKGVYTGTACDLLAEDWEVIKGQVYGKYLFQQRQVVGQTPEYYRLMYLI